MGYERQVFFPTQPNLDCLRSGKRLHGRTNRSVEDTIENMKGTALHAQALALGQVVNTASQDVVFGDNFLDIEGVFHPLQTVGGRGTREKGLGDRLFRPGPQGRYKLCQKIWYMIIECRHVEVPSCGQRPNLRPPLNEQGAVFAFNELCKFVENVDAACAPVMLFWIALYWANLQSASRIIA